MIFGKHINKYYLRFLPMLLLGIATLVAVDYLQLIVPNLYQLVVNGINDGFLMENGVKIPFDTEFLLVRICKPLLIVIVCMVTGRFLWRICFFGSAIRMETQLRNEMFSHARTLSCQYYHSNKVGNLMSLFTNDLDTVQDCFGSGILMFCDALLLGVLAVGKMFAMDPVLTAFSLIPMALLLASATVVGKAMTKRWDIRQAAFSRLSDFSQESFSGIAVIKAFVKETRELMAFRKLNTENEDANVRYTRIAVLLRILVTLFVESVICIILGYGGLLVYRGKFNAGQLVEFIGYFTAIVWPVMAVSELIDMTSRGKASLNRVSQFLETKQDVLDDPAAVPLTEIKGEIRLNDLHFSYPGMDRERLKGVSLTIRAGEHVGIVGRTGCGKSTLVDLLLHTYAVPDGMIYIDGHDINTITIKSLRDGCAYVPQDNFLFSDTIANNISFGMDVTREQIRQIAALADVDENISQFPMGYDTVLGERGVTVSGGQKQRIAISRALARSAPILILDDSVSAVDTATEQTILKNLRETRAGKTTLLIAHRISTIESMDKILFLDGGKVVDMGTHAELLQRCEPYRKMVRLQELEKEGGVCDA